MTRAEAMALAEEAEAEATAAEALAAAASARARAIRLRREARENAGGQDQAVVAGPLSPEATEATETTEVVTADDTDAGDADISSSPKPAPRRRWWQAPLVSAVVKATAIIVICGLLTASGYLLWHHHDTIEQRQRTAAFVAAARQGVINMLSLDFNNAKQDVQRLLDSATGQFRDDFAQRASDFTSVVEQSKVVTHGSVRSAAVESMGKDSAVVLVLATEQVTNSAGANNEPRSFRLRVTVTRDADQIKMSKVDFVL